MKLRPIVLALAAFAALLPTIARAQSDFPSRQIRVMVGFPAGGSTDILARTLAQEARRALGQELIVINKPGATGALAVIDVVGSPADGYTIGVTPSAPLTLAHEFQNIPGDLLEKSDALLTVGRQRIGIAVKAESDIKTFKDFIDRARREPGKVSLGVPGAGTLTDVLSRAVFKEAGVEVNIVPFNGDSPLATAILGDHVLAGSFAAGGWAPLIQGGKLRLIVSQEADRAEVAPDVPTLLELGYPYRGNSLQFMYAPKGLPPAIRQKLIDVFAEASKSKVYVDIAKQNMLYDPQLIAGAALDTYLLKDRTDNSALVEKVGLKRK